MATGICLKRGTCGDVVRDDSAAAPLLVRDLTRARAGCRWIARCLARREARALRRLAGIEGLPRLIALEPDRLTRSFIPGAAMHIAEPRDRGYYREALRLLRRVHRAGIAHNDLAKEANWLCDAQGQPAIIDFQLATATRRRGRCFRLLAREDLRHLLKHKARYCPESITPRQQALLRQPSLPARCWRALFKPPYRFLTRRLLGWPERYSAVERERPV